MNYAYSEFYRKVRQKDKSAGFPKFKTKRGGRQSYTSQAQAGKKNICISGKKIKLPKLGLVKCRISKQVEGRILSASIFQVPSGKYYVSILCTDVEPKQLTQNGKMVGLHLGVKSLVVTSDGQVFENNRYLEKKQKTISRLGRSLSRKPKDSANREKARILLARAYEKVKNQKTDTLQKLTTKLVQDYDIICVRDEELSKMLKRKPFGYYLADASWGELIKQLEYKCNWYGKILVKVAPSYPSAQMCSCCGYKNSELAKKKLRKWTCPKCGISHDRARNAAENTLAEGLRSISKNVS